MKFEYDDGELDILDEELPEDDNSILNYCKTKAGHTIMINPNFQLKKAPLPNIYMIVKKHKTLPNEEVDDE